MPEPDMPQPAIDDPAYRDRLAGHLRLLRAARRHGNQVVRLLQRETPTYLGEKLHTVRRHLLLRLRRRQRRRRG
jgi:hypothetical protein